jgi:hypothetical protein
MSKRKSNLRVPILRAIPSNAWVDCRQVCGASGLKMEQVLPRLNQLYELGFLERREIPHRSRLPVYLYKRVEEPIYLVGPTQAVKLARTVGRRSDVTGMIMPSHTTQPRHGQALNSTDCLRYVEPVTTPSRPSILSRIGGFFRRILGRSQ